MDDLFFSIIIPTLNEEKNLPLLLKSIANQPDKDFEVIIADSGSTDNTKLEALKFADKIPNLRFAQHHVKNVGAARNYGASLAKGPYLIFLDADVEIGENFLTGIKEKINLSQLDALTVWNRSKKNFIGKLILGLLNLSMTFFQKIKPAANGPCMIVKKDLFDKIGGFDETITFGEDFDLIQRLHRQGSKFAVFQKPILYVSTRRFEKEGLFLSLQKSIKALLYQLVFGPIRKPIFKYEMGGQYYKEQT